MYFNVRKYKIIEYTKKSHESLDKYKLYRAKSLAILVIVMKVS